MNWLGGAKTTRQTTGIQNEKKYNKSLVISTSIPICQRLLNITEHSFNKQYIFL